MRHYLLVIALCLFFSFKANAVKYFWVGDTGFWSDLNHWSLTSGGSFHPNVLPGPGDSVYVNMDSFTGAGTLTVDVPNVSISYLWWNHSTAMNITINFGTCIFDCETFFTQYRQGFLIDADSATLRSSSYFACDVPGSINLIEAPDVGLSRVSVREVHAERYILCAWPAGETTIDRAIVGSDTCSNCGISMGARIGTAICRGQNFNIENPQGSGFYDHFEFDTLEFATPGGNYLFADSDSIYINEAFIINSQFGNQTKLETHTGGPFPVTLFGNMGIFCADYIQLQNIMATGVTQWHAGPNSTDLGGNSGWSFTSCSGPNVWPGDVNYDLTANNLDILYLGLAYGETGPVRPGASNNWVAQPMNDWLSYFNNGVDKKNADCDGSGLVDLADTLAVDLNYGQTHPARFANPENSLSAIDPSLILNATPDSIPASAQVHVNIDLGTNSIPVDSIYGIAFTVYYDPLIIDEDSITFDFSNSILGTVGTDMIGYVKLFPGQIDFAMVRTNHVNFLNVIGHLAAFDVVIVDNISTSTNSQLRLGNVTALTYGEYMLSINTVDDTLFIRPFTEMQFIDNKNFFYVYPNPSHNMLNIYSPNSLITSCELYDVTGKIVVREFLNGSNATVDINSLQNGMYTLKCITQSGTMRKKIEVSRD